MSTGELTLRACEVCGARVPELRRNRCWGCYAAWAQSRPVGIGACCTICGERRRAYLKQKELLRAWVPLCHNCAGQVADLSPLPQSIEGIRALLTRDRRRNERRRGTADPRAIRIERRGVDRRTSAAASAEVLFLDEGEVELVPDEAARSNDPTLITPITW